MIELPQGAPSVGAVRACLDWWRTLSEDEKKVFAKAKLTPASWWVIQPVYRLAVLASDECQEAIADGIVKEEQVGAGYVWLFENVTAIGQMEVWRWAKSKNHGRLLAIKPYAQDTPYNWQRMLVKHNESSPFFQSFIGRAWMKDQLGKKWAKLVNKARKMNKQDWLAALSGGSVVCKIRAFHHSPGLQMPEVTDWNEDNGTYRVHVNADPELQGAKDAINRRLEMDAAEFWRYAKGVKLLPRERLKNNRPYQLELFSEVDE